jgi:hypothetical protein
MNTFLQAILSFLGAIISALLYFFSPLIIVCVSIFSIISFLLGALLNPQGLLNQIVCSAIDYISYLFPSTPESLKLGSIINSATSIMPAVGRGVIADIFATCAAIFALTVAIKIYKLIPFKAT